MKKLIFWMTAALAASAGFAAVPRPWTPVRVERVENVERVEGGERVEVTERTYSFASNALPVSVVAAGEELLAAPMRVVVADNDGREAEWTKGGSWLVEKDEESATLACWQESDLAIVDASVRCEFDGMMRVALSVYPGKTQSLRPYSRVWIEIPLKTAHARLFANFPRVWGGADNIGGVHDAVKWPFKPYVWLGDERRGLCWFCESDEKFLPAEPKRVIEVLPEGETTVLRIRLADRTPMGMPPAWVFGLQATPVKPFDRSWNENHVLEQMRAKGDDGKREHVWKTLLRPDAVERFIPELDKAVAAGVKTVQFHEDWIRIQNCPIPSPSFKDVVKACHDRGLKVLVYLGYELSALDPLFVKYHDTAISRDHEGVVRGWWYRQPGQRDPTVCYASGFAEEWLARAKKAYVELGIDGYYLDGTICAEGCYNPKHGCGWTDADGVRHVTYPFFAYRRMMRALYEFVDGRGGVVNAHQSGYVCPATLGFCHAYWDGEHIAMGKDDPKAQLDTKAFRAEFMGRNHGVPCELIVYPKKDGSFTYGNGTAISLLHDVLPRPNGCDDLAEMAPVWKVLDAFRWTEADWMPYWENPIAVSPEGVKASVYRKGDRNLIVVSNLTGAESEATVTLPSGATAATDARKGTSLAVQGGKVTLTLPSFAFALVETK